MNDRTQVEIKEILMDLVSMLDASCTANDSTEDETGHSHNLFDNVDKDHLNQITERIRNL